MTVIREESNATMYLSMVCDTAENSNPYHRSYKKTKGNAEPMEY